MKYMAGFGNHFSSEAVAGALPQNQNSPQKVPLGLYAEQHSGTSFLMARHENQRSWLYRIRPSVLHGPFSSYTLPKLQSPPFPAETAPNQLRFDPIPDPSKPTDFLQGLFTIAGNGSVQRQAGCAVHLYAANQSMKKQYFMNSDGDFLIVPQLGKVIFHTEYGSIEAEPGEMVVIQRGIKFQVEVVEKKARGYICENYGQPLRLPNLGPIGANGLAEARHFEIPVADYEDKDGDFEVVNKFQGKAWIAKIGHSPLDVVAWHGNYTPYKYDLRKFTTIGSISFDHPDPSIFTVLTSPSEIPGMSNLDFVIFPERWMIAEHTFRPPYYHRNIMSEFMGNIMGKYDAKETGFIPGASSIHNCMAAHGPDAEAYEKATKSDLKPMKLENTLSFLFESRYVFHPTEFAMKGGILQREYKDCWSGLKKNFKKK